MKRTIRVITSSPSIRLGDRGRNEYSPIHKNSLLGAEALEEREDRAVLLEAMIHFKQARRRPEKVIFLDWNDVKHEWE
ncbi:MAG: hypothetical protein SW833_17575 [Cyanobacteriota bacterium]|nr:hypothetical protein [Cyanobacteriota bacterium]